MKSLFRRYLGALSGLVSASVLLVGVLLCGRQYSEDLRGAQRTQAALALAASASIQEYLNGIGHVLGSLESRVDEGVALSREAQSEDFREALKFEPAVLDIRSTDREFRETNFVARTVPDRRLSLAPVAWVREILSGCRSELCFGPAFIRDQTEPYLPVVVRGGDGDREILAAEISLRFVNDVLLELPLESATRAYVVDLGNRMLAHPDLRILLRNSDLSGLPQVQQVRAALRAGAERLPSVWGRSPSGEEVLTSASEIGGSHWLVFVEQPATAVLAAARQTIAVTLLLLVLGLLAASVASWFLARHLARPIRQLRDGAARFGAGDLSVALDVRTGDEVESVALAFNRMADSLRALYGSLESKVQVRTHELAQANTRISAQAAQLGVLNTQLEQQVVELAAQRAEAVRANAAKTRFVAAASHDLRQPMHAVGLLVGILAGRQSSPENAGLLNRIQVSVTALEGLFGALLDISRLDAGVVHPDTGCISVASLLKSVELAHAQDADHKKLRLRIAECRTLVRSDSALLLSILNNLVSNAIRYTQRGCVDLFCRKRGGYVEITVADSGIGIAAEQMERVFEEFYQVEEAGRERGPGLGLGLAIVRRTAALLGHELLARSRAGMGSVFGIRVPVAELDLVKQALPPVTSGQPEPLAGAFVVVVDDDEKSRFATEAIFLSWHCHVISGANAALLREALSQHLRQPDLMVVDYRLRDGVDGVEVIRQLRADAELAVPAIILTADLGLGPGSFAGMPWVVCLQKPASAPRLLHAALVLLDQVVRAEGQVESL